MPEDLFYRVVKFFGGGVYDICSRAVVLHPERGSLDGGFLLAANHLSPFDVPCLMKVTRRHVDFVSIIEMFEKPLVGWLFGKLNAMPLDRFNPDRVTVRQIVARLRAGRVVAIFPEGGIRGTDDSVLRGGSFRPGFGQMAQLGDVPIVPCVVLGSENFYGFLPWLPLRRTRYAAAFGEPIYPRSVGEDGARLGRAAARELLEEEWRASLLALHAELEEELSRTRGFEELSV